MKFAVIQTRFERIPADHLVDAFVSHGGMPHPDAARAAHRDRGILGGLFTEPQANAVAAHLRSLGHKVSAVPAESIGDLGKPRVIRWCEIEDAGLKIPSGKKNEVESIDWQSVMAINAGPVAEFESLASTEYLQSEISAVGPAKTLDQDAPAKTPRSHYLYVIDLIAAQDAERYVYVRLPSSELAYPRIIGNCDGMSLFDRFQKVLVGIVNHSHNALVAPDARKLLVHQKGEAQWLDSERRHFAEESEFEQYDRWLLTLALRNADGKSTAD